MYQFCYRRLLRVCIRRDCATIKRDALTPVCCAMAKQIAWMGRMNRTDAQNDSVRMSMIAAIYVIMLPKGSSALVRPNLQ